MIAVERILVAHEFTENAAAALNKGVTLAGIFDATCEVLVVERSGTDAGDMAPVGFAVEYRHGLAHDEIVRYGRNADQAARGRSRARFL